MADKPPKKVKNLSPEQQREEFVDGINIVSSHLKSSVGRKWLAKELAYLAVEELMEAGEASSDDSLYDALEGTQVLHNAARALLDLPIDPSRRGKG